MAGFREFLLLLGLTCLASVGFSTPALKYLSNNNVPDVLVNNTDTDKPCILAKFNITLGIYYKTQEGNMETANIVVPENATKNGKCNGEFFVSYTWPFENTPDRLKEYANEVNGLAIGWKKDDNIIYINAIVFTIAANSLPDPSNAEDVNFEATDLTLWPAAYGSSMECQSEEFIRATGGSNENNSVTISGKYQIGELTGYKFTTGDRCSKDRGDEGGTTSISAMRMNVGAIAGGVVAALVVLICVSAFGLHFYRRSKKQSW